MFWPLSRRFVYGLGFCLSLWAILSGSKVPSSGRALWASTWFDVQIDSSADLDEAMILMISGAPLSYLIPSFGHDSRFIRINGPEYMNTWAFQSCAADKLFALTSSAEDVAELRDCWRDTALPKAIYPLASR